MLREADRNDCSLVLCNFEISLKVARAVRDLLVSDPFDRTWEVKIFHLGICSRGVFVELAQALSGAISSLSYDGWFFLEFVRLSIAPKKLKKFFLQNGFFPEDPLLLSSWVMQHESLEEFSLQYHPTYTTKTFLCQFLTHYSPTSQLQKLSLDGFSLKPWMVEKFGEWQNLEDLSLRKCTFQDSTMRFATLTHLRRLEVSFHQVHHLTDLISHPGCQLKIVDAHRVVLDTPRVTEEKTGKLIMALKKNKTIEAFHTHNDQFDMLFSPYV